MIRSFFVWLYTPIQFEVTQYRWGRKIFKGKYYYIIPLGNPSDSYWGEKERVSDQFVSKKTEEY